ncbi:flagellin [Roseovarius sp.]
MMTSGTIGDMAQTFRMRQQTSDLKQRLDQLTLDLTRGVSIDQVTRMSGGLSRLSDIEHHLVVLDRRKQSATEAQVTTSVMQTALERVQTALNDLAATAVLASPNTGAPFLSSTAQQGRAALDATVAALNTTAAGQSIFAGADVAGPSLVSADDIMTAARAAVAGASSAEDIMTTLSAMFDAPGGVFESALYQGGTDPLTPFQLGSGESVLPDVRADDPVLRSAMKNMVAAALIDDPAMPLPFDEKVALARLSGQGLYDADSGLVTIRGNLGHAESRIEAATTRLMTELNLLEQARNDLMAVDPFEAASELQTVQTQLETLYTITARSSRLSLVAFLR